MKILVTGGAGCIGSRLAFRLLEKGHHVKIYDNLSSGKMEHIKDKIGNKKFEFVKADILDRERLKSSLEGVGMVYHAAANPDIKYTEGDPTDKDLVQNTVCTYNVLEAMRVNGVKKIVFFSSSAVYGMSKKLPTPEESPLEAYSLYGASKIAGEALTQAYSNMFGMQCWIFRLANIIGPETRKAGRTAISDFILKLKANPEVLEVLGNGKQKKSYLYVDECVDGILLAVERAEGKSGVFNLCPDDSITVGDIAKIVIAEMGLNARIKYRGGEGGWKGDIPRFLMSNKKIKKLGWKPRRSSEQAVRMTVRAILEKQ